MRSQTAQSSSPVSRSCWNTASAACTFLRLKFASIRLRASRLELTFLYGEKFNRRESSSDGWTKVRIPPIGARTWRVVRETRRERLCLQKKRRVRTNGTDDPYFTSDYFSKMVIVDEICRNKTINQSWKKLNGWFRYANNKKSAYPCKIALTTRNEACIRTNRARKNTRQSSGRAWLGKLRATSRRAPSPVVCKGRPVHSKSFKLKLLSS